MKIGILGLGEGRSMISAVLQSELWELGNICDLNEDLCRTRCNEFGLDGYTLAYEDLLHDPEIDVIGVYSPDRFHADHILQAIAHDKHVICTKPLLDSLERGSEVLAASTSRGKTVFVGQSTRFYEPMIRQRQDFGRGELGDLITVEAHYHADHRWFLQKAWTKPETFKWLYGCLSHPVDLVRWYLPNIEEVMGYGTLSENGRRAGLVAPDVMHVILKSEDGRIARVSGCYSSPTQPAERDSGMSCILRGEEGCSQADYSDLRYAKTTGGRSTVESFEALQDYYWRFEGKSHHAGEYQNYIEYFARSMEAGITPKPDVKEGLVTMAVLQAMDESITRGVPVKIREVLERYGIETERVPSSDQGALR